MNSVEGQRVMPHGGYECDTQILHTQASAGNAIAMYPAGTGQSLPITRLLGHLSHFKFLAAEKELANAAIAPLVRQLPLDQASIDVREETLLSYGYYELNHILYMESGHGVSSMNVPRVEALSEKLGCSTTMPNARMYAFYDIAR